MPLEYDVDVKTGTVLSRGVGAVIGDDVLHMLGACLEDRRLASPHRELADLRGATAFGLDAAAVRAVAAFVKSAGDRFRGGKVAYVAEENVVYGIGRMFEVYAADLGLDFHVFRDVEAARDWLGLGEEDSASE